MWGGGKGRATVTSFAKKLQQLELVATSAAFPPITTTGISQRSKRDGNDSDCNTNNEMIEVDVESSVCRIEKDVSMTATILQETWGSFTIEVKKSQQPHTMLDEDDTKQAHYLIIIPQQSTIQHDLHSNFPPLRRTHRASTSTRCWWQSCQVRPPFVIIIKNIRQNRNSIDSWLYRLIYQLSLEAPPVFVWSRRWRTKWCVLSSTDAASEENNGAFMFHVFMLCIPFVTFCIFIWHNTSPLTLFYFSTFTLKSRMMWFVAKANSSWLTSSKQ